FIEPRGGRMKPVPPARSLPCARPIRLQSSLDRHTPGMVAQAVAGASGRRMASGVDNAAKPLLSRDLHRGPWKLGGEPSSLGRSRPSSSRALPIGAIMQRIPTIAGCARIVLMCGLALIATGNLAASSSATITCPYLETRDVTFEVPATFGDLPDI